MSSDLFTGVSVCVTHDWLPSVFQSSANSESSNQSLCSAGSLSDKELEVSWKGWDGSKCFALIQILLKLSLFVAYLRHQRREPATRGAGKEKATPMTAIVKVIQILISRWKEKKAQLKLPRRSSSTSFTWTAAFHMCGSMKLLSCLTGCLDFLTAYGETSKWHTSPSSAHLSSIAMTLLKLVSNGGEIG